MKALFFLLLSFLFISILLAGESDESNEVKISGQWFIGYQTGTEKDKVEGSSNIINEFFIRRSYLNFKKKVTDRLSGRITSDVAMDLEGQGAGDLEMRLKYCYVQYDMPSFSFLTKPYIEFGVVHRPWLDYEQQINLFRVQGTMFIERSRILNSADFGVLFVSMLGGVMDEDYQKNVSKKYPGRYGSISFGVFNGAGYHAIEVNENKSLEARVSLRPFPEVIPGLQISYHGINGTGNTPEGPKWDLNMGFVSYESRVFVATGQYYIGNGNSSGSYVDVNGKALKHSGYSLFTRINFFNSKLTLIGRFDYLQLDQTETLNTKRYIAGLAYNITSKSKVLIDYDFEHINDGKIADRSLYELVVEFNF